MKDLGKKGLIGSDNEAIDVAMSYMKGGRVDGWTEVYYCNHYNSDKQKWPISWDKFRTDLIPAFTDITKRQTAWDKLQFIKQGKMLADNFFKEFEILLSDAGYN